MKIIRKKQIWYSFILSLIISIGMIIHGIFIDLDFSQIQRFTIGGFIVTFLIVFIFLLIIEKIFDMNNESQIQNLKGKIKRLERKK